MVQGEKEQARFVPEIVECYRDFEAPADFRNILNELLSAVPSKYLLGLRRIILANQSALTRDQRRQKIWSGGHKIHLSLARGAYYKASRNSTATIWLYVDNILRSEDPWWRKISILRYQTLAGVLYHELGHHIHATQEPQHADKETVAEEWSHKLSGQFYRRRYRYLMPVFYPLGLVFAAIRRIRRGIR